MPFTDSMQVYEHTVEPGEYKRLTTVSTKCCPGCGGSIYIGEEEAAGMCTDCYFRALRDPHNEEMH